MQKLPKTKFSYFQNKNISKWSYFDFNILAYICTIFLFFIPGNNTILDILRNTADASVVNMILTELIEQNEEVKELFMSDEKITIFVPINEAFEPKSVMKYIEKVGYEKLILSHVIHGSMLDVDLCGQGLL